MRSPLYRRMSIWPSSTESSPMTLAHCVECGSGFILIGIRCYGLVPGDSGLQSVYHNRGCSHLRKRFVAPRLICGAASRSLLVAQRTAFEQNDIALMRRFWATLFLVSVRGCMTEVQSGVWTSRVNVVVYGVVTHRHFACLWGDSIRMEFSRRIARWSYLHSCPVGRWSLCIWYCRWLVVGTRQSGKSVLDIRTPKIILWVQSALI